MKGFAGLTKRNLLIFFKDRQSVIFSLLTSIIVLALYLLFLKGSFVDAVNSVMDAYKIAADDVLTNRIDMFANLILLTGILGSAMITVPFNCLTTLVRDRENKIDYDILATPLKRGHIILSYFVSAAVSSVILTGIILAAGLLIISGQGETFLNAVDIAALFGIVCLGSVSATSFFMIIILFFKSTGASGAFFGMLSAAAGFVIGAYIPISQFSDGVQTVCNIFPASQVTIILRNRLLNGLLGQMDASFGGADQGMFVKSIKDVFTFKARVFGMEFDISQMVLYVIAAMAACLILQVVIYSKTYRKK